MDIQFETIHDILVIGIHHDTLDVNNIREFKSCITANLEDSTKIILDLQGVQFIDSSGLGAILSCMRSIHARKGKIIICGASQPVRILFEMVRLHRVFDIVPSKEEALKRIEQDGE